MNNKTINYEAPCTEIMELEIESSVLLGASGEGTNTPEDMGI